MRSKWMQSSPRVKASVGRKDSIESQYLENDCDDVVFKPKDGRSESRFKSSSMGACK